MPSASPAILVYSRKPVTRAGLLGEDFFLIDEFSCNGTVEKTVTKGIEGEEIDVAVGPVTATWRISGKVLSQRGAADTHPGTKVSPSLLANFDRPRFGISPSDGLLLFMGGEFTERPGKLAEVTFTIDQHFISRNAGSPDDETTPDLSYHGGGDNPGAGSGNALSPYFTNTETEVELPYNEEVDFVLTAGGEPDIVFAVASGYTLPAGLTLDGSNGEITGIPSVTGDYLIQFTATNDYGVDNLTLLFKLADADVDPPAQITAYIRFLNTPDVGNPFYSAISTYYNYSDYSVVTLSQYLTDVGDFAIETDLPLYDEDGVTEIGTREILEVYATRAMAGLSGSGYLYRKSATDDNIIAAVLRGNMDPVTVITGDVPERVENPTNPTNPSGGSGLTWPPVRQPDERLTQYYVIEDIRGGKRYLFSSYTSGYTSGSDFVATYPGVGIGGIGTQPVVLDATETDYWQLKEICDQDGTSVYSDSGYSVCEDLIADGKSPRNYGQSVDPKIIVAAGVVYAGSSGQTIPSLLTPSGYSLPSPIGTVAPWLTPSGLVQTYVLVRDALGGKYICYGYADEYFPSVSGWYNGFSGPPITYTGAKNSFAWYWSDVSPRYIIVEIFRKGDTIADEAGDGYIYLHSTQSTDRRIERILSHNYTPVGHPLNSGSGFGANLYPL